LQFTFQTFTRFLSSSRISLNDSEFPYKATETTKHSFSARTLAILIAEL